MYKKKQDDAEGRPRVSTPANVKYYPGELPPSFESANPLSTNRHQPYESTPDKALAPEPQPFGRLAYQPSASASPFAAGDRHAQAQAQPSSASFSSPFGSDRQQPPTSSSPFASGRHQTPSSGPAQPPAPLLGLSRNARSDIVLGYALSAIDRECAELQAGLGQLEQEIRHKRATLEQKQTIRSLMQQMQAEQQAQSAQQ
jgi:hypothetical protein